MQAEREANSHGCAHHQFLYYWQCPYLCDNQLPCDLAPPHHNPALLLGFVCRHIIKIFFDSKQVFMFRLQREGKWQELGMEGVCVCSLLILVTHVCCFERNR